MARRTGVPIDGKPCERAAHATSAKGGKASPPISRSASAASSPSIRKGSSTCGPSTICTCRRSCRRGIWRRSRRNRRREGDGRRRAPHPASPRKYGARSAAAPFLPSPRPRGERQGEGAGDWPQACPAMCAFFTAPAAALPAALGERGYRRLTHVRQGAPSSSQGECEAFVRWKRLFPKPRGYQGAKPAGGGAPRGAPLTASRLRKFCLHEVDGAVGRGES